MDEVAEAWCRYTERREHAGPDDDADDADPDWWAIEFFMMLPIFRNERVYRSGLLALLSKANTDFLVSCVAAGPLENFISDDESDLRWRARREPFGVSGRGTPAWRGGGVRLA
jgi:hypothetical protein